MAQESVVIKKYSNRRLYDTRQSAYITLDDLAVMIRDGEKVEVVEAGSGEDVTAYILTQILLEEAKKKKFLLPVELLHLMIRYSNHMMGEYFNSHLGQLIETYAGQRNAFEEQFKTVFKASESFSSMARKSMEDMAREAPSPFDLFTPPGMGKKKKE